MHETMRPPFELVTRPRGEPCASETSVAHSSSVPRLIRKLLFEDATRGSMEARTSSQDHRQNSSSYLNLREDYAAGARGNRRDRKEINSSSRMLVVPTAERYRKR